MSTVTKNEKLGDKFRAAMEQNKKNANLLALKNFADTMEGKSLDLIKSNVEITERAARDQAAHSQLYSLDLRFPYNPLLAEIISEPSYKAIYNFCKENNIYLEVNAPYDSKARDIALRFDLAFSELSPEKLPTFAGDVSPSCPNPVSGKFPGGPAKHPS
jgi:hypothetical protein